MSAAAAHVDDFADLPAQMRAAPRWLVWKSIPHHDPGKKPRKLPFYASGEPRNGSLDTAADLARLVTLEDALDATKGGGFAGLGFALGPDGTGNVWQGVDLDDLNGHDRLRFVADDLPGYVERSPSGHGVHALGYGRPFASLGANATGIEAYAAGRYFTVTGESVSCGALVDIADFVERRLAPLHSARRHTASEPPAGSEFRASIDEAELRLIVPDLRSALAHLRADDRELWIRMGHALKTLGETGRGLWLAWSQTSEKYDAADAARVWGSLQPIATGYRAVFAEAQRQGWVNPASARSRQPDDEYASRQDEGLDLSSLVLRGNVLAARVPPPRPWHVPGLVPGRTVTLLSGDGGLGKSTLGLQLAVATVAGQSWLRRTVTTGPALYLSAEDDADEVNRRVRESATFFGLPDEALANLHVLPFAEKEATLAQPDRAGVLQPTRLLSNFCDLALEIGPRLIVLDSLADVFGGNEIDRNHARQFIAMLRRLAIAAEAAVVVLAHPSLTGLNSGSGMSGSTHWNNAVRSRLYMSKPKDDGGAPVDPDARVLSLMKANYAPAMGDLRLRRCGGGYEVEAADAPASFSAKEAASHAESLFLDLLDAFTAEGRSVTHTTGRGYAPLMFALDPRARGTPKRLIESAMNKLFADGKIRVSERGPPSKRTRHIVRVEQDQ